MLCVFAINTEEQVFSQSTYKQHWIKRFQYSLILSKLKVFHEILSFKFFIVHISVTAYMNSTNRPKLAATVSFCLHGSVRRGSWVDQPICLQGVWIAWWEAHFFHLFKWTSSSDPHTYIHNHTHSDTIMVEDGLVQFLHHTTVADYVTLSKQIKQFRRNLWSFCLHNFIYQGLLITNIINTVKLSGRFWVIKFKSLFMIPGKEHLFFPYVLMRFQ